MKNIEETVIEERTRELLLLIKEASRIDLIERELALLAVDLISALRANRRLVKTGCNCFLKIDFAISGTLRKKMNEEARDLLNEMVVLDELRTPHGPDLHLAVGLAKKILARTSLKFVSDARKSALMVGEKV